MSRFLLGMDVGTTSLKGCVFDETGREIASVSKAYSLITKGGFVEFPAEKYFELFKQAYDELSAKTRIDALAIDTQGETLIFLDGQGKPLTNAIVWLDNRAAKEAVEIERVFGLKRIYEVTGQTEVPAGYPAPKILWLKRNKPEIFAKTRKIVLLEDYLIYRLTGKFASERSLYSSTLYLDIRSGGYWKDMLGLIGIDEGYLPELKECGEFIGEYRGASVCTGALDQVAGFLGSGITREEQISEMTGTALAVCAPSRVIPPYREGIKIPAYYVAENRYCLLMWAPTAGMVKEWFKKNFCEGLDYEDMDREAAAIPFGSEGLVVSPNMCGSVMPEKDSGLKCGFYGVELKHTRAHFTRAIMESVACLLKTYQQYLGPHEQVVSIGGGSKSRLWLQIKADITGKPFLTLENKETGCLGAAILAGVGSGAFASAEDAVAKLVKVKETVYPDAKNSAAAKKVYDRYCALENLFLNRGYFL